MERDKLKRILGQYYSDEGVKSLLQGRDRMIPSLSKAFFLEEKHKIPVSAWKDIKSFIINKKKGK
jgi:hypothetical protein